LKVLVAGASGYFGSIMVDELLNAVDCQIILAGRNTIALEKVQNNHPHEKSRTAICQVHLDQFASIEDALAGIDIAVCAAGPFQDLPHLLLEACLSRGIHYIDMADDRAFVSVAQSIASEQKVFSNVCTGWSTVPALSAVLVEIIKDRFDSIDEIQIAIAPGNRSPRAPGTVASLLESLDKKFDVMQAGTWNKVKGWSARRHFKFPPPIGKRSGYLVDVPDLVLFPEIFGARTVEFRAGAEIDLFNRGLTALSFLSSIGLVKSWRQYQSLLQLGMSLFGFVGTDSGAAGVAVRGICGGRQREITASVIADSRGQNMPVMPAVIMVSQIVQGSPPPPGVVAYNSWLTRDQLEDECRKRNYRLVIEETQP
jgi:saccharopine dehydrogenase-like NADP-dependent oxidoreductase